MQEKHQNGRKYGNTVDAELLHAFIGKQHSRHNSAKSRDQFPKLSPLNASISTLS